MKGTNKPKDQIDIALSLVCVHIIFYEKNRVDIIHLYVNSIHILYLDMFVK